jgi:hypothetical protein
MEILVVVCYDSMDFAALDKVDLTGLHSKTGTSGINGCLS